MVGAMMVVMRTWWLMRTRRTSRRYAALAVMALVGLTAAACGSSGGDAPAGGASTAQAGGTADVAYAGSLTYLNEKIVGPAFAAATHHAYQGRGAGSLALSREIAAGEITPNVFESIGGKPIEALEPKFTKWYVQFATTQIVLAYNPASKYASQLQAIGSGRKPMKDLFTLLQTPGFKLGRTDPNLDPQGAAFIEMLMLAQAQYHLPAGTVEKIIGGRPASAASPTIFDETALEPRLQAGQLDAASAYLSQAIQLHLHYITLPATINLGDPALKAHYATASFPLADGTPAQGKPLTVDITTIGAPSTAGTSFVSYVLSPAGLALHKRGGYTLLPPKIFGDAAAIPAAIRHELGG